MATTGGLAGPAMGAALHSLGAVSASTCAFMAGTTGVAVASVAVGSWGTKVFNLTTSKTDIHLGNARSHEEPHWR